MDHMKVLKFQRNLTVSKSILQKIQRFFSSTLEENFLVLVSVCNTQLESGNTEAEFISTKFRFSHRIDRRPARFYNDHLIYKRMTINQLL